MFVADALRCGLEHYDLAELDAHAGAIYGVDRELRLGCFNAGWFRFAAENGGEPEISAQWRLGRPLLECVPAALRPFYDDAYRTCLRTGNWWRHEYECSSASHHRRYHQVVYPIADGAGLLIVNSLVIERAHDARGPDVVPDIAVYSDRDGMISQCAHCRRVQHAYDVDRWDWIPQWVTAFPKATSHGVCPPCYRYHYPTRG